MILCRFKSPPWGFLFINYFSFFFFILTRIEHQRELVYTHNAEQIKNKDDRGKRWLHCSSHLCSFEEIQYSRTHLYNISTQQRKAVMCLLAASHDLVGRMIAVKHFACSVHGNLDAESNSWTKQESLSARCLCMCAAVRCVLVSVRTFPFTHTFPCAWILQCVSDVSAMHSSAEMNFKWRRTRRQQFPELFSWKRCTFSTLNVIALLLLISVGCKTSGKHSVSTQFQSSIHGQWRCSKLYSSLSSQIRVSVLWFSKQKHKKDRQR